MKELWVKADTGKNWDERKKSVTSALESGADTIFCAKEDMEKIRGLGKIRLVSDSEDADLTLEKNAFYRVINSKEDEVEIAKLGVKAEYVIVNALDWKIIPLENLIAALQGKCRIIVEVEDEVGAKTALETLEVGSDGVLISDVKKLKSVKKIVEEMSTEKITLTPVIVEDIKPVGMGDRVCVDTCSMLNVGEGMLVGSQSNALFLIHSESIETEYVAARPFRVNAGPVHAYTKMPDGKTRYLSEIKTGDEVLAVDKDGNSRAVIVGRMKIEKRPLILIEASSGGKQFKTILQNAETILLVSEDGSPVSISRLKKGDKIMAYVEEGGRHFGMKVAESIEEK